MSYYSNEEMTDMILIYGEVQRNSSEAVRVYRQRYPGRQVPNNRTFTNLERRLRERGTFARRTSDSGRSASRHTTRNVERAVIEAIEDVPSISTRRLGSQLGIPHQTVWRIARMYNFKAYHHQPVQELLPRDYDPRVEFCTFMRGKLLDDPSFLKYVLFTDESCFTRAGVFNSRNEHHWAQSNPHSMTSRSFQRQFAINVWAGIVGTHIIGPFRLPNRLTSVEYLNFLENDLPSLLEEVPLEIRRNMWYLHDGAPPHSTRQVTEFLNEYFLGRFIARFGDYTWPPRSPDLNPLDFFFWGHLKQLVYSRPVETEEELWNRILTSARAISSKRGIFRNVRDNFKKRITLCIREEGKHFEHLM